MNKSTSLANSKQSGFTIIELMIATTIFSVILVMSTIVMVSIGRLYYKSINQSRVQDSVRTISEEVSHQLQLSDKQPIQPDPSDYKTSAYGDTITAYCVGGTRYSYAIGRQIGSDASKKQVKHVLWRDNFPGGGICKPADLSKDDPDDPASSNAGTNGVELIPPGSRLIKFTIPPPLTSPYTISIGVAYGEDDLLCSPSVLGSCANPNPMLQMANGPYQKGDLHCKGQTGSQFCAIAGLTTVVGKRLTSN